MASFRPLSALTYRNFRLFWFGQLISLTGTWMHSAAQGWLVLKLTDSPFYLGLAGTAGSIPILLFTLAGGVIADRFPKRYIILTMYIVLMLLTLTLAVLVSTTIINVWYVLIIAFFIGTAYSFEIPARQSFLIELVGKENLLNAIALNSTAFNGARAIGPAIAGIIIGRYGVDICFYINALSFLFVITGLLKMRFNNHTIKSVRDKGIKKEIKEGLKYIFSDRVVSMLILFIGIISFFGFPYITFLPVFAKDILGIGAKGLGILMALAGAGALAGAVNLVIRGDSSNKERHLTISAIVFSASLLIFSLSDITWLSYIMLFLIGWGAVNQIATANTLLQLKVPDGLRGRVMSSFTLVFLGMASLGNFVVGSLAHYAGTQTALMICAVICIISVATIQRRIY